VVHKLEISKHAVQIFSGESAINETVISKSENNEAAEILTRLSRSDMEYTIILYDRKKIELAVTKNFSWKFVKISIIRCQS
jgi:hypothetical protein